MSYTYKKEEFSLLPEGEYECVIDSVRISETQNGKQYINLSFKVREDVEQEYKGRLVFESIWKEKEGDYFNRKRINRILGTQEDITDGQDFATIEDVLAFIEGAFLICVVGKRMNDYTGNEENYIKYYKKSEKGIAKVEEFNEEDLPF